MLSLLDFLTLPEVMGEYLIMLQKTKNCRALLSVLLDILSTISWTNALNILVCEQFNDMIGQ